MKAVEFIKKHGCEYTVDLLKNYPSHTHTIDDGRMFFNENTCANSIKVQLIELVKFCDLKPYIDAWELVQNRGGLDEAKDHTMVLALIEEYEQLKQLRKAIHLVEEVGECNE